MAGEHPLKGPVSRKVRRLAERFPKSGLRIGRTSPFECRYRRTGRNQDPLTGRGVLSRFACGVQAREVPPMNTQERIAQEVTCLPEPLQREVYDCARFLRFTREAESFNGLLLSEAALARDWNTAEEDAAWASL